MSQVYEIPLQPNAQTFQISLGGTVYGLTLHWCDPSNAWTLDVADNSGSPLVQGLPLITGADLLAQYAYLGIGGKLLVQSDFDVSAVPGYTALGSTGHLFLLID